VRGLAGSRVNSFFNLTGTHGSYDWIDVRARVSEVLNRRRDLTIAMIARIRENLGIPADTLIARQRAA
jgi:antitoxin component HigA of HigAB toxin-antitoxin module